MTPLDLFTPAAPHEDIYREQLQRQREQDQAYLHENHISPPWVERERVLDRDEYKILTLIADHAGAVYYGGSDRAKLAEQLGFLSTGNLEAAVKKTTDRGLVRMVTTGARIRMCLTEYGRDMLEQSEEEDGWDMVLDGADPE